MLKYFRGATLKIYLYEYLTHEYFHTRKFPDLRYIINTVMTTLAQEQLLNYKTYLNVFTIHNILNYLIQPYIPIKCVRPIVTEKVSC